jgi:hypothetical protein
MFFSLFSLFVSGQKIDKNLQSSDNITVRFPQVGTYQIQITDSREKPGLSKDFLQKIEEVRDRNKDVYLPVKNNIKVFIPSSKTITSKVFIPLKKYLFITSSK